MVTVRLLDATPMVFPVQTKRRNLERNHVVGTTNVQETKTRSAAHTTAENPLSVATTCVVPEVKMLRRAHKIVPEPVATLSVTQTRGRTPALVQRIVVATLNRSALTVFAMTMKQLNRVLLIVQQYAETVSAPMRKIPVIVPQIVALV